MIGSIDAMARAFRVLRERAELSRSELAAALRQYESRVVAWEEGRERPDDLIKFLSEVKADFHLLHNAIHGKDLPPLPPKPDWDKVSRPKVHFCTLPEPHDNWEVDEDFLVWRCISAC